MRIIITFALVITMSSAAADNAKKIDPYSAKLAADLKKNWKTFSLHVSYKGKEVKKYHSIGLNAGPERKIRLAANVLYFRLQDEKQILQIIDCLAETGILTQAMVNRKSTVALPYPCYIIGINAGDKKDYAFLRWNMSMFKPLDALHNVLEGDAKIGMKKLLDALAADRAKWKKEAAMAPGFTIKNSLGFRVLPTKPSFSTKEKVGFSFTCRNLAEKPVWLYGFDAAVIEQESPVFSNIVTGARWRYVPRAQKGWQLPAPIKVLPLRDADDEIQLNGSFENKRRGPDREERTSLPPGSYFFRTGFTFHRPMKPLEGADYWTGNIMANTEFMIYEAFFEKGSLFNKAKEYQGQRVRPFSQRQKDTTLADWYMRQASKKSRFADNEDVCLMLTGSETNSPDVWFVKGIEKTKDGLKVETIDARWPGALRKNAPAAPYLGVNLGRMPAGTHKIQITIVRAKLTKFAYYPPARPKEYKIVEMKPESLTVWVKIEPAKK